MLFSFLRHYQLPVCTGTSLRDVGMQMQVLSIFKR
jgi:hypothetical protein